MKNILHLFDIGKITIKECEYKLIKERDDFAVRFGEYLDSLTHQDMAELTIKELLETYKKDYEKL